MIKKFIHQFASPKTYFYQVNRLYPWLLYTSISIYISAIIWGLFFTPKDFVQGHSYRIIYFHVPASFVAQSLYAAMAISSAVFLIWRVKLAAYLSRSIAPVGAMVTFIALVSGSIWGIPTWGTWWEWDARITSTLILFIMYLGLISLHNSFNNFEKLTSFFLIYLLLALFKYLLSKNLLIGGVHFISLLLLPFQISRLLILLCSILYSWL